VPYGFGNWASAGPAVSTTSAAKASLRIGANLPIRSFCARGAGGRPWRVHVVLRDGLARTDDALLRIRGKRLVLDALGAERVLDRVVAFEALVRQQLVSLRRHQRQRNRERCDVGFRIVDLHLVAQ